MELAVIYGTRPEIIKLAPVIKAAYKCSDVDLFIIHSGQHYDYEMSKVFLDELNLPSPDFHLKVGSGTHAKQTAKTLIKTEKVLLDHRPKMVIVQGDTNTALAGALASVKLKISVAHIEAGCRSFNIRMPEEINRIIVDHISTLLFPSSSYATQNLLREGISNEKIHSCGNTIVDVIQEILSREKSFNAELNLTKEYAVITVHRSENVDDPKRLKNIVDAITKINGYLIFPVHPRTQRRLIKFNLMENLRKSGNVILREPTGYFDFIALLRGAKFVLTDSGGIQEEAAILHIPCITIRDETEWPETVEVGANILVGVDAMKIIGVSNSLFGNRHLHDKMRCSPNPFGGAGVGERILQVILDFLVNC